MAWPEQLQDASFRGVPFSVLLSDAIVGRRGAVHEYPQRDKPWVEDLGRRARAMSLDAIVIGADYMARRDRLVRALEEAGPGELVHPYFGRMQVSVIEARISEGTADGGSARFALSFLESGASTWPQAVSSTPDQVAVAATESVRTSQAAFADNHQVAGQPDFVAHSAQGLADDLADQVSGLMASVSAADESTAELQLQLTALTDAGSGLVYDAAQFGAALAGVVEQLVRNTGEQPSEALALARPLWSFGELEVDTSTASARRRTEMLNRIEVARLVRTTALAEAARAVSLMEFDSFDASSLLRAELADAMDELLLHVADDAAYDALRALRATVIADITARGADLVRLVRVTPPMSLPLLLLTQSLYGDGLRADDVLARNSERIAHPLFVPGGVELEVLADA